MHIECTEKVFLARSHRHIAFAFHHSRTIIVVQRREKDVQLESLALQLCTTNEKCELAFLGHSKISRETANRRLRHARTF